MCICTCVCGRMRLVCVCRVCIYIWSCMSSVLLYLAAYAINKSTRRAIFHNLFQAPFPPQLTGGILVPSQMVDVVSQVQLTHPQ